MKKIKEIKDNSLFENLLNAGDKEERLFVSKSLMLADQILEILRQKGMTQKDLANSLDKSEAEISKWLCGFHNLTLRSIVKIEANLNATVVITPNEAIKKVSDTLGILLSRMNNKSIHIKTENIIQKNHIHLEVSTTCKMIDFKSKKYVDFLSNRTETSSDYKIGA